MYIRITLVKMQISGSHPQNFWVKVWLDPENTHFNKSPGDTMPPTQGPHCGNHCTGLPCFPHCNSHKCFWDLDLRVKCYRSSYLLWTVLLNAIKSPVKSKVEDSIFLSWLISPLSTFVYISLSHWPKTQPFHMIPMQPKVPEREILFNKKVKQN